MKGKEVLAYAAGIIDGEGCISLSQRKNRKGDLRLCVLCLHVVNTNEWLIRWLQMQFGGSIYFHHRTPSKWKNAWSWRLSPKATSLFLQLILPYLQIKRPQAEIAIRFQSRRKKWGAPHWGSNTITRGGSSKPQESYILEEADRILMKELNKKGK